ncbi:ABC-F family ATP-binding cassette domain-containing protein [Candidatus Falkowbacteria bacterium]|jgi:ATP-binding cassette, subfamily F, member 3|nr:ABC-F family ATP-binding cassette domain-containing protein [Candidatus Falkowbacteria bacterium]MBT4433188.1 ABC-F family ATP-binding cassette domain-containing protein [Candidatus Falkowbacteria bacterium]
MELKVTDLRKEYDGNIILNDISFVLNAGQKVGLVGYNGTGKTTLLKILSNEMKGDGGKVQFRKGVTIGYVPQDTRIASEQNVRQYLSSDENNIADYKMERILNGLDLSEVELNTYLQQLSSGQKSKVFLAKILLVDPNILLLDEPTNNLDIAALVWLENFLKQSLSTCLIVSHDRVFLDNIVNKIFELNWQTRKLTITNGRYSEYLQRKEKEYERQLSDFNQQQKELARLSKAADNKRRAAKKGSKFKGRDNDKYNRGFKRDRAARSGSTVKALQKRIDGTTKVSEPISRDLFKITINDYKPIGTTDISFFEAIVGYRDFFQLKKFSLNIPFGSRVVFLGSNGAGKSTIIKTISGENNLLFGRKKIGNGLIIGNLAQEHQNLPLNKKLLDFLSEKCELSIQETYHLIKKFGFKADDVQKQICNFSPGERARILLATFSALSVNVLLLDEPTNHLDLEALIAVEKSIKEFSGTIILVSHDRYFLRKFNPTHIFSIDNYKIISERDIESYLQKAEEKGKYSW